MQVLLETVCEDVRNVSLWVIMRIFEDIRSEKGK